jgi:hypothetical protein
MNGLYLSLFSMNCGATACRRPSRRHPWPVDDDQVALGIEESCISRVEPSLGVDDLARRVLVLEKPLKTSSLHRDLARSAIFTSIPGTGRPALVGLASVSGWSETRPLVSVDP